MVTHHKHDSPTISIMDAVETLSNIADLELDQGVGVAQEHDLTIFEDLHVTYRTVHWLQEEDAETSLGLIRELFRVVLDYLKHFYRKENGYIADIQTIDGIKTIMVLVGEAAKKLDKYTGIFQNNRQKSVTTLKEYKQLQEFYHTRIAKKIDESVLGKWILALTQQSMLKQKKEPSFIGKKSIQTKHVFIDFETVKKDTDYELFLLRKEDGTRFFNPRLIRNIQLICDFGDSLDQEETDDPLRDIKVWNDRCLNACANDLIYSIHPILDRFFHEIAPHKHDSLVSHLNKACVALILCSYPKNLMKNSPVKNCTDYFKDFQDSLRVALNCSEYQRLIAYPPKKSNTFAQILLETIHSLCSAFFTSFQGYQEMGVPLQGLIQEAGQHISREHLDASVVGSCWWSHIAGKYFALSKLLKKHPNGPLFNLLNRMEEGSFQVFDPLMQNNIPCQLYSLHYDDTKALNIRIPAPVYQEYIHKAKITEEFKGFLRSLKSHRTIHQYLLFNFQDRTSWQEHFRALALEELQKNNDFASYLTVVTLPKNTEFYFQLAPYQAENHAHVFIKNLKDQLKDEASGFYFPEEIKKNLLKGFSEGVIEAIHEVFFSKKNVLLIENRLAFIEIFYLLLELKILEIVKPDAFSLVCKDGVDIGAAASAQLLIFLKLLHQENFSDADKAALDRILFGPSLLIRERLLLPDRFNRMLNVIKVLESTKKQLGSGFVKAMQHAFKKYFETPILDSKIIYT